MATTARVKAKAKTGHSESEPRSTSSPGTTPAPLLRAPDSLLASRSPRIVVRRQMVDSRVAADEEDAFSGNAALAGGAGVSTTVEAGTTVLAPSAASLVDAIVAPPLGAPEPTPPETAALPATETASGEVAAVEGAPIESAAATATREVATPVPVAIAGGVAASPGTNGAVELLMPPPPERLSAAEEQRLAAVQSRVGATGSAAAAMPPAESQVGEARSAVEEPETETQARAEGALVAALEQRPAPSPEIEELCERIYRIIRAKRPPDEESLVDAEPDEMARAAGGQLDSAVQGDVNRVGSSYDELQQEPSGTPQQQPQAMTEVPTALTGPSINASTATPTGVAAEAVSLDADVAASQQRLDEAGMTSDTAALIQDPANPVVQARETQGELEETAERGPAEVMAEQQSALGGARADMAALQQRALASLQQSRTATVQGTRSQQTEMVGSETEMRTQISTRAQEIINQARTDVQDLLRPLPETARNMWERGVAVLSTEFEQDLARVKRWIDERHSGVGGAFLSVADYLTGLPDWVTEEYDRAEQAFGDGVCDLLREISTEVNAVIAAAEAIIANANQDVDDLFSNLPVELQEWAAGERERIDGQLNDLHNQVQATQNDINRELTESASGAVQQVRERIHQLRQEAGGLLGRLADMVNRFLDDPIKFIIDGLLSLVGIAPASFWALVNRIQQVISDIADDPLGFAQNLLSAIGQGFQQFFDKFSEHLMAGFWDWLFSGLGSVGVEIPSDFSLKSIITFILQLLGITWDRIRRLLAKHIGEENVALIEKAWELVSTLIEMGPEGIFEMIKEQLNPQEILNQILQAAIDYLIETLIRQVTVRVVMLFNPVGAVVQAIEAIYKVLKWLFENAARIFSLIETVVNGMADIVAGNIGGMANAVESALARLIAPVIDFIAGLVGLGDLPNKIADTIKGLQGWIEGILDRVIGWLAGQARRLLQAVGIGGEENVEQGVDNKRSPISTSLDFLAEDHTLRLGPTSEGAVQIMMASDSYDLFPGVLRRLRDRQVARLNTESRATDAEELQSELDTLIEQAERVGRAGGPIEQARVNYQRQLNAVPRERRIAWIQTNGTLNDALMDAWDEYYYIFLEKLNTLDAKFDFSGGVRGHTAVGDVFADRIRNVLMKASEINVRQSDRYGIVAHPANTSSSSENSFYAYDQYAATGTGGWGPVGTVPPLLPYANLSPTSSSARHVIINDAARKSAGSPSNPSEKVPGIDTYRPHRGHLIGNNLGGPGNYTSGNIVPMTINANESEMKTKLENPVNNALNSDPFKNDPKNNMIFEVKVTPAGWNPAKTIPMQVLVSYQKIHPIQDTLQSDVVDNM